MKMCVVNVFIVQPTITVNETLMELLLMISTARRASVNNGGNTILWLRETNRKMQARVPISAV